MLGKTRLVIILCYVRPKPACSRRGQSSGAGFQWMLDLRRKYPKDRFLGTGDFNAHHPAWGYPTSDLRGLRLQEAAELANLILTNDLDYPTRFGLQPGHRDTTPDLTWEDSDVVKEWRCGQDPMGSDHYPIWIEMHTTGRARRTKQTQAINWDAFRQAVKDFEDGVPVVRRLSHAENTATRLHEIYAEDPVPDKHLFNLWESREEQHQAYLRNGKLHSDLIRVRGKTAQAKRYPKRLFRSRWFEHCASFDERTGLKKLCIHTGHCGAKLRLPT
ncbi:hypothetical protein HPB47_003986 [Ixodes persulcatus]|uniref:Uncharacterized protein n=1 Tax=Ixodes persulcatus TaxID=34615 RepID=A0AC60PGW4_IXOPE|nr:hypothetical protein HPB47_003986 [Ixodes persulcatus]